MLSQSAMRRYSWVIPILSLAVIGAVRGYPLTFRHNCSLCPPGTHVAQVCTVHSDTICRSCEEGTFSDIPTNLTTCTPCSACPDTMYIDRPCIHNSDTVCSPCSSVQDRKSHYFVTSCLGDVIKVDIDIMISDHPGNVKDTQGQSGDDKGNNNEKAAALNGETSENGNERHENNIIEMEETSKKDSENIAKVDNVVDDDNNYSRDTHMRVNQRKEVQIKTAHKNIAEKIDSMKIGGNLNKGHKIYINGADRKYNSETNSNVVNDGTGHNSAVIYFTRQPMISAVRDMFKANHKTRKQDINLMYRTLEVQTRFPLFNSDIDDNDHDNTESKINDVNKIHKPTSAPIRNRRNEISENENNGNKVNGYNETNEMELKENKDSNLKTISQERTSVDNSNDSNKLKHAPLVETVDTHDITTKQTPTSVQLPSDEDHIQTVVETVETNLPILSPVIARDENSSIDDRLFDKEDIGGKENGDAHSTTISSQRNDNFAYLPEEFPTTKLPQSDVVIDDTNDHEIIKDLNKLTVIEDTTVQVTSWDGLNEFIEEGIDSVNQSEHEGNNVTDNMSQFPISGENKEEDSEERKRGYIILGVAIGITVFVILAVLVIRCLKRRIASGQFPKMKMVFRTNEESVQLRPPNQSTASDYVEPDVQSTNGIYRQEPKAGPNVSGKQNEDAKSQKSRLSGRMMMTPLLESTPATDQMSESPADQEPMLKDVEKLYTEPMLKDVEKLYTEPMMKDVEKLYTEPIMKDVEKLKYIDDTTDDEFAKQKFSRTSDYMLLRAEDEIRPTSSSTEQ